MTKELTIVVPTYNERENITRLIEIIDNNLKSIQWELLFVDDDSPDGTAELIRQISLQDHRIRCLHRIRRRGLSSACIEGFLASSSACIAVLDADAQHDIGILATMYHTLIAGDLDLVIGSRYLDTGGTGGLPAHRVLISRAATKISQILIGTLVTDPMSGFFVLKKSYFNRVMYVLHGKGFKILLDLLLVPHYKPRYKEVAYTMRERLHGSSKLNALVIWEFFTLLMAKAVGRYIPIRFLSFAAVGLSGVGVHLVVLYLLHKQMELAFLASQASAILVAMTSNFLLNNRLTFRDKMLSGNKLFYGLLSFYLACSMGAVVNFGCAAIISYAGIPWWFAGLAGAIAGAIWNYATTSTVTWGGK